MFSSGDGGVGDGDADPTTQTCFTNDGKNLTKFIPGFPASCPLYVFLCYFLWRLINLKPSVTAVGATFQIDETAVSFSGGGFSNYFARPAYQEKAVTGFFKTIPKDLYQGLFNR
jgi:tripeptidyl-peptidase I